ncbi:MAG: deoxyribonuclease V [Planctomycetes bacterium]|nr:deoxyribonuclease V [Planctomycetota bacterium]
MLPDLAHAWTVSPREAIAIQERLRPRVIDRDAAGRLETVAGVDVGFERDGRTTRAAVAVLALDGLALVDSAVVRRRTRFPYVPGLLSFREIPAVLAALDRLREPPDLILCDGQGRAHPRRFGLACHLGVILDRPTVGVAKSRLCGTHGAVRNRRGAWAALCDGEEVIGAVLRTRDGVKPLFVSVGHRVSLARAIELTLACTPRYRLPETTRQAHRLASGR